MSVSALPEVSISISDQGSSSRDREENPTTKRTCSLWRAISSIWTWFQKKEAPAVPKAVPTDTTDARERITVALNLACLNGNLEQARIWIEQGADPYQTMFDGRNALFHAQNNLELLKILTRTPDHALYCVCQMGHLDHARALISEGVNPYQMMPNGTNAFFAARNNLPLLKVLTRTENSAAFNDCVTVHDFWEKIFPASRDKMPPLSEQFLKCLPLFQRDWLSWKEHSSAISDHKGYIHDLVIPSNVTSLEMLKDYLKEHYPPFNIAWKMAGEPKLEYIDHPRPSPAQYQVESHKIVLFQHSSQREMIESLFFETCNAIQRQSFMEVNRLLELGELAREDFTFIYEYLEGRSYEAYEQVRGAIFVKTLDFWVRTNQWGHADIYRTGWDIKNAWKYIANNRRTFEDRLQALRTYLPEAQVSIPVEGPFTALPEMQVSIPVEGPFTQTREEDITSKKACSLSIASS